MRTRARPYAVAVGGGLVTSLAAPPLDLLPAVFAGLALLAVALRDAPGVGSAFLRAAAWAAAAMTVGLGFLPTVLDRYADLSPVVDVAAVVLLAVVQSFAWGVGGVLAHLLARRLHAPEALAFAAGVFAACQLPALFGWSPASLLSPRPELVQLAELVGERGVSFVVAAIAALLARAVLALAERRLRAAAVTLAGVLVVVAVLDRGGAARMSSVEGRDRATLRMALLDQAAPPHVRRTTRDKLVELGRLRRLSARADAAGAQLVVWPEAAYPLTIARPASVAPFGPDSPLTPGARAPRLFGFHSSEQRPASGGRVQTVGFNSASVVLADGSLLPFYDKVRLLSVGETVPFARRLPWLEERFRRPGHVEPGAGPRPLTVPVRPGAEPLRLGVLTCYEDTFTDYGRETGRTVRPALLVNISNSAWFAETTATAFQARSAYLRAIELRTDLVRAVNGGESSWVAASGRVVARRQSPTPGILHVEPRLRPDGARLTAYARFGDWPVWGLVVVVALASLWRARRARRGPEDVATPSGPVPRD